MVLMMFAILSPFFFRTRILGFESPALPEMEFPSSHEYMLYQNQNRTQNQSQPPLYQYTPPFYNKYASQTTQNLVSPWEERRAASSTLTTFTDYSYHPLQSSSRSRN